MGFFLLWQFFQAVFCLGVGKIVTLKREVPYLIDSKNSDGDYHFSSESGTSISIQCSSRNEDCESFVEVEGRQRWCGGKNFAHVSHASGVSVNINVGNDDSISCAIQATDQSEKISTSCDCGRRYIPEILHKLRNSSPLGRIFQGDIARKGEFTWMVGILDSDLNLRCGGSLITPHHILTAAHCAADVVIGEPHVIKDTFVTIGKIIPEDHDNLKEFSIKIEKNDVYIHEEFLKTRDLNHDIAILFMKDPVQFGPKVGPVCLPKKFPDLLFSEVLISGWGLNEEQWLPRKLQYTRLYTIPMCDLQNPNMICIYRNGTGTCRGDSGGPVMHYDEETKRYFQVSLVSYGYSEECLPGFTSTTNLTRHYEWIEKIVRETKPSVNICTKL